MTDHPSRPEQQPSAWQPPPPPPPPAAGEAGNLERRSDTRTPLDRIRSPYGPVIALFSVLIFVSPNLLMLVADGFAEGPGTSVMPEGAALIVGLIFTIVLQLIVFGLALLPLLAADRPFRRLFGPTRGTALMWATGLGVGIVTVVVTYTVNAIFVVGLGNGEGPQQDVLEITLVGGAATVLAILIGVVFAPVTEEIIFRGVLFRALADKVGMWGGAVISAAVFAVIHVEVVLSQPLALAGLFSVGLLLALAYHRTGSLLVPIVGHAVFNGLSFSLALLADRAGMAMTWVPTRSALGLLGVG